MNTQPIKMQIENNIIVAMSEYLCGEIIQVLQQIIIAEFVKVNMEEITTLPAEYHNDTDRKNQYIIQLFICKKRIKENTKEAYLHAVKRLIVLIDKPLTDMDTTDISYYLNWYEKHNILSGGKKNQPTTMNNERRFLSAFFTWLRKEKLISENPVESTEPLKVIHKPIDYYKADEIAKMRDACKNPRERALIEVLRSTGMRGGELISVSTAQIDWTTGDILILGEKSDRYRPVYLDDDAQHYYKIYLDSRTDDSEFMFPTFRNPHKMMTTCGIRSVLKTIGKRAKIKIRVYPHKMRKTLGMNLKNKGVDIGTIQEIMGHASSAVTAQYYAQSTPETLRSIRKRVA